jgi:hypothetical protein
MWPGGVRTNDPTDMAMARGEGGKCRSVYRRFANVSSARRSWAQHGVASPGGTNCTSYIPVGSKAVNGACSCVNFATRVWRQVTADRERWQLMVTPANVAGQIYLANGYRVTGLFDNGKMWN